MILKLLTDGSEYEFLGCYRKGKDPNGELRFLVQEKKYRGQKHMFWIGSHPVIGTTWNISDAVKRVTGSNGQIVRQKNYNYYFIDNDHTRLERDLLLYKQGRTMSPSGNHDGLWVSTYSPILEFNGSQY